MDDIEEMIAAAQAECDAWQDIENRWGGEKIPQFTSGGVGVNYTVRNGRIVFA